MREGILRPVRHLRGGIALIHNKNTANCESIIMPSPEMVSIPLSQHVGAQCEVTVKNGDKVYIGTMIGKNTEYISAPIHSSVSGTVTDIVSRHIQGKDVNCVLIESDKKMLPDPALMPFEVKTQNDIAKAAELCGLVGLGGAGFPAHVKLSSCQDKLIDTLIINGAECEPFITSDYRECIENYNDLIEGIYLIKNTLKLKQAIICIENNKPKAIEKLFRIANDHRDFDDTVKLMTLPSTYPQGAEKAIIYSATGRALPNGKLPVDVGCIVMNITSIGTLYRFITSGMPLVSKRITVDGTAVNEPKNIIVPIGTSVKDILEFSNVSVENDDKIILGGPMMGKCVSTKEDVIDKRTNALLVMKSEKELSPTPCIHCGRCAAVCPMKLYPASVEAAYNHSLNEKLSSLNVNYCMECGSCAYVCPAKRPLTQVMRIAKSELRRQKQ